MTTPQQPSDTLAQRMQMLSEKHNWMDPAVATTLASAPVSNDHLSSIADSLKQQVADTWDGIGHFFDDPVLHKTPTASLALQRYITGAIGTPPILDTDLQHIQTSLQGKGFGKDLPANGVWDGGWQAALQQHASEEYDKQLSGNRPGAVSSHGFLHSLLDSISPSGIGSAVVGFVKSIPADVGQAFSDFGAGLHDFKSSVFDWRSYAPGTSAGGQQHEELKQADKKVSLSLQNKLGVNQYRQAVGLPVQDEHNYSAVSNGINDIGTLFLLSGAGGAVKGIGGQFVKERGAGMLARDLSTKEAVRSRGVVVNSLLRPTVRRIAGGAAVGGTVGGAQAALTGGDVAKGIGTGAVVGGVSGGVLGRSETVRTSKPVAAVQRLGDDAASKLLPARYYDNLPVRANTGPILSKLTDNDGLYYAMRTRIATPYQYGAVRFAGSAMTQAQAFSLKAHAVGYLEHVFGGDQAGLIQSSINNSAPLNGINDAIANKLDFTVAGLHFRPDLDYLMYFLHGPVTPNSPGTATRSLSETTDGMLAALQNTGVVAQVEKGTGKTYHELLDLAGGDPARLHLWMSNKLKESAAYQHAQEAADAAAVDGVGPEKFLDAHTDWLRAEASKVWNDPENMKDAIGRAQLSSEAHLETYLKNQIKNSAVQPDAHLKHELSDYLDAGDTLTHRVLPHADTHLLTPQTDTILPKGLDPSLFPNGVPADMRESVSALRTGPVIPGSIGLARTTTLTSQQAALDVQEFRQALEDATAMTDQPAAQLAAINDLHDQMNLYAFHHFGMDARRLEVFHTPDKILNLLSDRSKQLAAEVHLAKDAPPDLVKAFADIEAKGYRVVAGTDIGHAFRSDLPPLEDLGKQMSRYTRIANGLGMGLTRYSRLDFGADRRARVVSALLEAEASGKLKLPPYYTVQTLLNDLQDDEIAGKQLPWAANAMFGLFRRAHAPTLDRLVEAGRASDRTQAEAVLKAHLASAAGLRQLTVNDVQRVLGRTKNTPWVTRTGEEDGLPLMDPASVREVYKALQKGFSQTPTHMVGLQKMEDFIRYAPFRFAQSKAGTLTGVSRLADTRTGIGMLSLPTRLAQLRDTYRFNLSPFFDLRRIFKTNVKMGADGVEPTVTPVKDLIQNGEYEQAHKLLDKIMPSGGRYQYLDEADQYLEGAGVFGLYNPRHYEAYYVAKKLAQGASEDDIKTGLVRVFQYGSRGQEGRTALERTTNVIFFPFSFEKTVARNIGGYLLDKPAQAMILSNALDAYRDFSNNHKDNPLALSWMKTHAPLLEEALRLNAFAHGMSPGELGGVNRPILNAFLPQSWATGKDTKATLGRFIPAVADLHRIIAEGSDQSKIINTALHNGYARITQGPDRSILNARPVSESKLAQTADARIYRADLINNFQAVLDYNNGVGTDEEKYHWGVGDNIPDSIRGQVIDRTTLGYVVKQRYPAYDPLRGAEFAIENKQNAKTWLSKQTGRPEYAQYLDFYQKAETAIGHLQRDQYPPEQAAQVQDLFRQAAIGYAQKDPGFFRWYTKTFGSSFGPLTKVG